jgi:diguanylate cyclase (GGDEF)-like protein
MPHTYLHEAHVLTERIRTEPEETLVYLDKDTAINFTISAGIAEVDNKVPDIKETIERADKALYRAKKNGRNQSQLFTD